MPTSDAQETRVIDAPALESALAPLPRWPVAVAGVAMQMVLGTVYAWSVFKSPLMEAHGWSKTEVTLTFTLMIGFLGLAAAFGGRFVDRAGARKVALVAAILFPIATMLAGLADQVGSKWLLWLGYGVLGGIGNGLGYITPIAVLVRWFPDKRGVITGTAVMGFGFGAAIMGQLAPWMITAADKGGLGMSIAQAFYVFAALFLVVMLLAAWKLDNPPAGWTPPAAAQAKAQAAAAVEPMDLRAALGTGQFYLLWAVLFLNITAGIGLISNHALLVQAQRRVVDSMVTKEALALLAGTLVALGALFNGLGRIFWSSVSDKLGRKAVFALILGTQVPVFLCLPLVHETWLLAVLGCYILACYGGGFSTMPAYVADTFGARNMGSIYGKVLLAWSAAGVAGPMLMEALSKPDPITRHQNFALPLQVAAGALVLGFVLNLLYRRPAEKADQDPTTRIVPLR